MPADAPPEFLFPSTPEALHAWVRRVLGVSLARRPVVPGNAAPFDYVRHAFFEGGRLLGEAHGPVDAVVWANRGGGKTFLAALATVLDLVFKPGVQVRLLGGSLEQSQRMHAHVCAFLRAPALAGVVEGRMTARRVALRNGSAAEILAQSHTSVRGTRVQKLRCDEVELFDPELWEAAQLVTRSMECDLAEGRRVRIEGAVEALSTMHRPYGTMQRVVAEAHGGTRVLFRWGVVDALESCPEARPCAPCALEPECAGRAKPAHRPPAEAGHVAVEDAVRMKARVGQATWEAEMLSLRPRRSEAVFPEFDASVHVVGDGGVWSPPRGRLLAGMDLGFRAPTVVLWAVLDDEATLWVLAERVRTETVLTEHARALADGPGVDGLSGPPAWVGVDPAARQRSDQTALSASSVLRKAGLRVRDRGVPTPRGVMLVRARLRPASGPPRLFVHARCAGLIESLERHHYPPDRPESTTPAKDGTDHACDALRYLVVSLDHRFEARRGVY